MRVANLFEAARNAPKVAIQIFSSDAMQNVNTTIQQKAADIENCGYTLWYCGMQSLTPEEIWNYRKQNKRVYVYFVVNRNCPKKEYDRDLPRALSYFSRDGVGIPISRCIDLKIKSTTHAKAFVIDKLQHLTEPKLIDEEWFEPPFPYGLGSGALLVRQKSVPGELIAAIRAPSTNNRHWVGIGRLCRDFFVRVLPAA